MRGTWILVAGVTLVAITGCGGAASTTALPSVLPSPSPTRTLTPIPTVSVAPSPAPSPTAIEMPSMCPTTETDGACPNATAAPPAPAPTPPLDALRVAELKRQLRQHPTDTRALMELADAYYAAQRYEDAAIYLDRLLAIRPRHVQALLARGAIHFNLGHPARAEKLWTKVVALAPDNQEAHYDLGFLYLTQDPPDWESVKREWETVIALDPSSTIAQMVQSHLDTLEAQSLLP